MSNFETPPEMPPGPQSDTGQKVGCWIGWVGLLFGFSPILIGMTASITCGPNANEGNCAAAAAPWFMFMTIPMGIIMGVIGIVVYAINKKQNRN